jgi:hypothetical protein
MTSPLSQQGWLLAVDFGTSNTAAAHVSEASGAVQPLPLAHAGNLMPSAVFVDASGQVEVGDVALNRAAFDPTGFIAGPKRNLSAGQSTFRIGAGEVPAHTVVAGVLRVALVKGQAQHEGRLPSGLVLTHPEDWSTAQIRVLTDAANAIGFPESMIRTVSEPRAAAFYYARGGTIRPGDRVAVFDFGGGTLDVAVLSATEDGNFEVNSAGGDNALGGRNFDAIIRRWAERRLGDEDPELLELLQGGRLSSREAHQVEEAVRTAKEVLSEAPQASIEIAIGARQAVLWLTRAEFEGLIATEVGRGTGLAQSVLQQAGGASVSAVYMTGGSSRIPMVRNALGRLGPVATLDDPKTVVAQGALIAVTRGTADEKAGDGRPWYRKPWALAASCVLVGAIAAAAVLSMVGPGHKSRPNSGMPGGPMDPAAAFVASLPKALRGAMTCQKDPTDEAFYSGTGLPKFNCTMKDDDPLLSGLTRDPGTPDIPGGAPNITGAIATDPAGLYNYMQNSRPSGPEEGEIYKVDDLGSGVVVTVDTKPNEKPTIEYGNGNTGLYFQFDGFTDEVAAKTFFVRAGL